MEGTRKLLGSAVAWHFALKGRVAECGLRGASSSQLRSDGAFSPVKLQLDTATAIPVTINPVPEMKEPSFSSSGLSDARDVCLSA